MMIIYGSSISPFVRKVVAFAAEKGLEFKAKGVVLNSQDPTSGRRAHSEDAGPARRRLHAGRFERDRDLPGCVEARPPLIPSEPRARGKAIWWMSSPTPF